VPGQEGGCDECVQVHHAQAVRSPCLVREEDAGPTSSSAALLPPSTRALRAAMPRALEAYFGSALLELPPAPAAPSPAASAAPSADRFILAGEPTETPRGSLNLTVPVPARAGVRREQDARCTTRL
jgi:hypothetical protein